MQKLCTERIGCGQKNWRLKAKPKPKTNEKANVRNRNITSSMERNRKSECLSEDVLGGTFSDQCARYIMLRTNVTDQCHGPRSL